MDWGINTRITGNHPDGRSQLCSGNWWKLIDCFSIFCWKCTLLQPISHYWCSYYPFMLYCPVICSLMEQTRLECKSSMVFLRAEKQTNASADWLITPIIFITGESASNANTSILGLLLLLPSALCVLHWLYVDEKWPFSCWTWRTRFNAASGRNNDFVFTTWAHQRTAPPGNMTQNSTKAACPRTLWPWREGASSREALA